MEVSNMSESPRKRRDRDIRDIIREVMSRELPPGVPTRAEAWRRRNPNALRTWTTTHGCVVQFWGMRIYYGNCADCGVLVTARRNISHPRYATGQTNIGRWPKYCDVCNQRRDEEHNDRARGRMQRLRAQRYAVRSEQYKKAGLPEPRQGIRRNR